MTILDFVAAHPDLQISELAKFGYYDIEDLYEGLIHGYIDEPVQVRRSLAIRIFCVEDASMSRKQRCFVLKLLDRKRGRVCTLEVVEYYDAVKAVCRAGNNLGYYNAVYVERAKDAFESYFKQLAAYGLRFKAHEGCLGAATAEMLVAKDRDVEAEAQLEMLRTLGGDL